MRHSQEIKGVLVFSISNKATFLAYYDQKQNFYYKYYIPFITLPEQHINRASLRRWQSTSFFIFTRRRSLALKIARFVAVLIGLRQLLYLILSTEPWKLRPSSSIFDSESIVGLELIFTFLLNRNGQIALVIQRKPAIFELPGIRRFNCRSYF